LVTKNRVTRELPSYHCCFIHFCTVHKQQFDNLIESSYSSDDEEDDDDDDEEEGGTEDRDNENEDVDDEEDEEDDEDDSMMDDEEDEDDFTMKMVEEVSFLGRKFVAFN
jgi:hypothetical protein